MKIILPLKKKLVRSSTSTGAFSGSSTTIADVTNASVTIVSDGIKPWKIKIIGDGSGSQAGIGPTSIGATINGYAQIQLREGSTVIDYQIISNFVNPAPATSRALKLPSSVLEFYTGVLSAGSHTLKLSYLVDSATTTFTCGQSYVLAEEIDL